MNTILFNFNLRIFTTTAIQARKEEIQFLPWERKSVNEWFEIDGEG